MQLKVAIGFRSFELEWFNIILEGFDVKIRGTFSVVRQKTIREVLTLKKEYS